MVIKVAKLYKYAEVYSIFIDDKLFYIDNIMLKLQLDFLYILNIVKKYHGELHSDSIEQYNYYTVFGQKTDAIQFLEYVQAWYITFKLSE